MLKEMVGNEFEFYGVCFNEFKLNDKVYEAIEDESDGYRSYLESVIVKESDGVFFKMPLAIVRVEESSEVEGWELVDAEDGHVWLAVGTDNYDDYYPCFVFRYSPKTTQVVDVG